MERKNFFFGFRQGSALILLALPSGFGGSHESAKPIYTPDFYGCIFILSIYLDDYLF